MLLSPRKLQKLQDLLLRADSLMSSAWVPIRLRHQPPSAMRGLPVELLIGRTSKIWRRAGGRLLRHSSALLHGTLLAIAQRARQAICHVGRQWMSGQGLVQVGAGRNCWPRQEAQMCTVFGGRGVSSVLTLHGSCNISLARHIESEKLYMLCMCVASPRCGMLQNTACCAKSMCGTCCTNLFSQSRSSSILRHHERYSITSNSQVLKCL